MPEFQRRGALTALDAVPRRHCSAVVERDASPVDIEFFGCGRCGWLAGCAGVGGVGNPSPVGERSEGLRDVIGVRPDVLARMVASSMVRRGR